MFKFNTHSELQGLHAFLSASKYHWVNYSDEKVETTYKNILNTHRGTELHELAHDLIRLRVALPETNATLNAYVNDAIGYKMKTEVLLFASPHAFGTCDAISFGKPKDKRRKSILRIHDLKTGESRVTFTQLEVYVAFFCIEYQVDPRSIDIELRIYQHDSMESHTPDVDRIRNIMATVKRFSGILDRVREEMYS